MDTAESLFLNSAYLRPAPLLFTAMKFSYRLLWYIACTTFLLSTVFGKKQRVQVKGRLFCGDKPASKVTLLLSRSQMSMIISNRKLRDNCSLRWAVSVHNTEFFPDLIKDDTLAKQETREDGSFHLDGTDDEIGTIEPELKIYHRCNSKHICKRRWIIKIPDKYIYSPSANEKVFDVGTINLEIHLKEDKKCLPV
ncbi:hypothetical protein M513_03125 [Trichuris suis]|uniref:Transthyretin-like family protein n=1 Tax=Trichuris suis TaxID=68888 RepID=A0A085MFK5_9BILA|nr:hypothetical protein M513_03125 [Trichuris suis]